MFHNFFFYIYFNLHVCESAFFLCNKSLSLFQFHFIVIATRNSDQINNSFVRKIVIKILFQLDMVI